MPEADDPSAPGNRFAPWKEKFAFLESAEREFYLLLRAVQAAFLSVFPEFARHPSQATVSLDVAPLRARVARWRLKVQGGHRQIYRIADGRPDFEMFETREGVYQRLQRYLISRRK